MKITMASYITRLAILIPALCACLFAEGEKSFFEGEKTIYGVDNRQEPYQVPATLQDLSKSVISIWKSSNLMYDKNSANYLMLTRNFGSSIVMESTTSHKQLSPCPNERFVEQPVGSDCSGFLVGPDLVVTAGHCMATTAECKTFKFVFGFAKYDPSPLLGSVPESEVYSCLKLLARKKVAVPDPHNRRKILYGPDYALIKLSAPVTNHAPLIIERLDLPQHLDELVVMGHPMGLPLKVSDNAKIRNIYKDSFTTDLDTFSGNSGSPVFNTNNRVTGILVRGGTDFKENADGTCAVTATFGQDEAGGESVTKISLIANKIPPTLDEQNAFDPGI